jgi:septal ring-binding cell division protein DamX
MRHVVVRMLALLAATTLLQGCQRSTPVERPADTEPARQQPTSPPAQTAAPTETGTAAAGEKQTRLGFDDAAAGQPPTGFVFARTGKGAPGAPSPIYAPIRPRHSWRQP